MDPDIEVLLRAIISANTTAGFVDGFKVAKAAFELGKKKGKSESDKEVVELEEGFEAEQDKDTFTIRFPSRYAITAWAVHMCHCNIDLYEGSCKYGDDDNCPALKDPI